MRSSRTKIVTKSDKNCDQVKVKLWLSRTKIKQVGQVWTKKL